MESLIQSTERLQLQEPFKTGYVYSEVMRGHEDPEGGHPECPDRISSIHEELLKQKLLARCVEIPIRPAERDELQMIHTKGHCDTMDDLSKLSLKELMQQAMNYNSIYFNEKSLECAKLSAGGTIVLTEAVMKGQVKNGVAIVRPPGHHAESNEAMGFCMYNQVAIAAALARQKWGAKKVAIIDWDVHFGNGTYNSFIDDDSVLYVSTHRWNEGLFYPAGPDGGPEVVGKGKGQGFSVHVGWNQAYIGDGGYLAAFESVIMPICREFNPDLVLVSAGFDAAEGDPLGRCSITPKGYAHMTKMLSTLADGRVVIVLEGGYNLNSISKSFAACTSILLGDEAPLLPAIEPEHGAVEAILRTMKAHAPYWKCMKDDPKLIKFKGYLPKTSTTPTSSPKKEQTADSGSSTPTSSGNSSTVGTSSPSSSSSAASSSSSSSSSSSGSSTVAASDPNEGVGFAVEPLLWCPHLDLLPEQSITSDINALTPCELCSDTSENWVCLHCFVVGCSRYVREHMAMHFESNRNHPLALSFSDVSVWCYECESYVHNQKLVPYKERAYATKQSS